MQYETCFIFFWDSTLMMCIWHVLLSKVRSISITKLKKNKDRKKYFENKQINHRESSKCPPESNFFHALDMRRSQYLSIAHDFLTQEAHEKKTSGKIVVKSSEYIALRQTIIHVKNVRLETYLQLLISYFYENFFLCAWHAHFSRFVHSAWQKKFDSGGDGKNIDKSATIQAINISFSSFVMLLFKVLLSYA